MSGGPLKPRYDVTLKDTRTGQTALAQAPVVINATGPWADRLMSGRPQGKAGQLKRKGLVRSKGIHAITRPVNKSHTVVLHRADGSHVFVVPWRGCSILGTTDTRFDGQPDSLRVTREDISDVLTDINDLYGAPKLGLEQVDYFYGGLRPLTDDSTQHKDDTYSASRRSDITDHSDDGRPGFFTALGGKYTTSRELAEQLVDRVCAYLPGAHAASQTSSIPLPGAMYSDFEELVAGLARKSQDEHKARSLGARYGALGHAIIEWGRQCGLSDDGGFVAGNGETYYADELSYMTAHEDIVQLSDLYFRRAGFGTTGNPAELQNRKVAALVGQQLGWKAREQKREVSLVNERYLFD